MLPLKENTTLLPVVDDITTSCSGATLFSTLDAEKAFYQIQLDEESSKLLTFNTPFGRYRYLRMPMHLLQKFTNKEWSKSLKDCRV